MLTLPVVRRTLDHLRRPFTQRLITLGVSTLLAMSLVYTTSVIGLPPLVREVASYASNPSAPAHLRTTRIQSLMPKMRTQAAERHGTERRPI